MLRELHGAGRLDEVQFRFVGSDRPTEELYDLEADPHEMENLVTSTDREHRAPLGKLRRTLAKWMVETDDQGQYPESDAALRVALDRWGEVTVAPAFDRVRCRHRCGLAVKTGRDGYVRSGR